ncbi:MAG: hypothetical protein EA378_11685 [Phycisphaerales bacterium]|nr:MAG: hypothetical protein EA378_11685 [Phycisphaerales bacterium]
MREKLQPVALGGLAAVVGGMLLGRVLTPRRGRPAATASIIGKLGSAVLGSVVMARVRKMI